MEVKLEILAKITKVNKENGTFDALLDERRIKIDPTVGCHIPYSFFDLLNLEKLAGKSFCFEGIFSPHDPTMFLSEGMSDPITGGEDE